MRRSLFLAIFLLLPPCGIRAQSSVIDFEDITEDTQPYLMSGYRLEATPLQAFSVRIRPTRSLNAETTENTAVFPNFGFDDHGIRISRADEGTFSLLSFDLLEPNSLTIFPGPGECRVVAERSNGSVLSTLVTVDGTSGAQTFFPESFHDLVSVTFEAAGEFSNFALDNVILANSLLLYSQLALGGGFDAILYATNRSGTNWQGRVELNGGSWPSELEWTLNGSDQTGQSGFDILLGPNQTHQFVLSRTDSAVSGWLEIRPHPGSDPHVLATAFFYNFHSGMTLEDSTGVSPTRISTAVRFPVRRTLQLNTGLAVRRAAAPLTFTLYNQDGDLLQELTSPFDGATYFHQLFFGVSEDFLGSLEVRSTRGFFIVVLRQEFLSGGAFQLTSIPALDVRPE